MKRIRPSILSLFSSLRMSDGGAEKDVVAEAKVTTEDVGDEGIEKKTAEKKAAAQGEGNGAPGKGKEEQ